MQLEHESAPSPSLMEPLHPHVIVLFGATGDLARRKLLPGLLHLSQVGLVPECRIVGTSLDELSPDEFRRFARQACDEFATFTVNDDHWAVFERKLTYASQSGGPAGLEREIGHCES